MSSASPTRKLLAEEPLVIQIRKIELSGRKSKVRWAPVSAITPHSI